MRDTRCVIRLENFHDLPVRLLHGPSGPRAGVSSQPSTQLPEGPQEQDRHVTVCPPKGRSAVRQAGTVMSVYRDLGVSADTGQRCKARLSVPRTDDPVAELEQLTLDPLAPQRLFSVASRSMSAAISALTEPRMSMPNGAYVSE